MKSMPFGRDGKFYKGNLHTHSTNSDGAYAPAEVMKRFRDKGYDFMALSDHLMACFDYPVSDTTASRDENFTTLISAELHQGKMSNGEWWHVLAVGLPLDFAKPFEGETCQQITQRAADAGAFIGLVHPSWNGLTTEDAKTITCAHAVEIYNHGSEVEVERGQDWPFLDLLLNDGWRLNGFATDDAHQLTHDWLGGWIHVKSESLNPDSILEAMKAGQFYSSQGPEIHDVVIDGDDVHVTCSPAARVSIQGYGSKSGYVTGESLTEATLPISRYKEKYMRITVRDEQGLCAWTNPIWFD